MLYILIKYKATLKPARWLNLSGFHCAVVSDIWFLSWGAKIELWLLFDGQK